MSSTHTSHKSSNDDLIAMLSELDGLDKMPEPEVVAPDVIEVNKQTGSTEDLFSELLPFVEKNNIESENADISALLIGIEDEIEPPAAKKPKANAKQKTVIEEKAEPEETVISVPAEGKVETKAKIGRKRFTLDDLGEEAFKTAGLERVSFMGDYNNCPVKAMDKVQNVMAWSQGLAELSVYTVIAMTHLVNTEASDTSGIRLAMMNNPAKPYPASTASAQAGQMMSVLPTLGMAVKNGKTLSLNADSPLVKKFKSEAM